MDKKKNIPQLRFPEFEGEWVEKILNDTCTIVGGGTPDSGKEEFWNGHIQWFTPTEIKMDYVSKSERTITELGLKKSSARLLPDGTILLTSRATIGEVAIALNECTTNQGFQSIIVNKSYNNLFIFNWIKNNRYQFVRRANGSTFLEISKSEIGKIPICAPTLPEQQKIASFFTAIDQKICQLKRKKTLLEQYKEGVMQKIFSQEIRFKDNNGQEFPKWEKMTGNALFETVSNKNHNSDLPILAITQEHGAIPRDMIDYFITVSEQSVESYKVVEKGDFIISLRSFQGGIEYSEYKGICSPAYIILRATQRIDHRYFKYYFKTDKYITDLNRKLEGIRDGKMISYKYFSEIKINVPSLPEQTKISNFLSAIDGKITHTQNQIEKAEVWKKGLMQQMFV